LADLIGNARHRLAAIRSVAVKKHLAYEKDPTGDDPVV